MPRYFFNVRDGFDIKDDEGSDFPDVQAARLEAVRYSGQLLKDNPQTFWMQHDWRIEVTDRVGLILFAIHISAMEAPALKGRHPDLT